MGPTRCREALVEVICRALEGDEWAIGVLRAALDKENTGG